VESRHKLARVDDQQPNSDQYDSQPSAESDDQQKSKADSIQRKGA
jgi:hypothetical protein